MFFLHVFRQNSFEVKKCLVKNRLWRSKKILKSHSECDKSIGSDEKSDFEGFDHPLNFEKKCKKKHRVKKNMGCKSRKSM